MNLPVTHTFSLTRGGVANALVAVAAEEGTDLQAVLGSLREKDLVLAGEGLMLGGEPELAFKHVLIRDVAYAMLPRAVRAPYTSHRLPLTTAFSTDSDHAVESSEKTPRPSSPLSVSAAGPPGRRGRMTMATAQTSVIARPIGTHFVAS